MNTKNIKRKAKVAVALIFSVLLIITAPATAIELGGANFKSNVTDEGTVLSLQGLGLKSVLFFKAFAVGFYMDEKAIDEDPLGDVPKHIEVEYFTKIPAKKLNQFTIRRMRLNVSEDEFGRLSDSIELMKKYFVDLKPGDRYSLTYIPEVGTKFFHNGSLRGVIKGKVFAKALFSVWIGIRPFDERLKAKILGLSEVEKISEERESLKI